MLSESVPWKFFTSFTSTFLPSIVRIGAKRYIEEDEFKKLSRMSTPQYYYCWQRTESSYIHVHRDKAWQVGHHHRLSWACSHMEEQMRTSLFSVRLFIRIHVSQEILHTFLLIWTQTFWEILSRFKIFRQLRFGQYLVAQTFYLKCLVVLPSLSVFMIELTCQTLILISHTILIDCLYQIEEHRADSYPDIL